MTHDIDLVYTDDEVDSVYVDGPWGRRAFVDGRPLTFNTGCLAARPARFTIDELEKIATLLPDDVRTAFAPTGDQPFLNHVYDALELRAVRTGL